MVRDRPIKDCIIALRCDHATKEFLERLADSFDVSLSHLILRLIQSGAKLEKERRSKLRGLVDARSSPLGESKPERA